MQKTNEYETVQDMEDSAIVIDRTPDFFLSAQQLSEFIHNLPLDQSDNDRLIALMVEQVQQAEKGAFEHGFRFGVECCRHGLEPEIHKHITGKFPIC